MSILDKLLVKSDTAIEAEAAKPLLNAQAFESIARGNVSIYQGVVQSYSSLVNAGMKPEDIEDYLAGIELFAESMSKVVKAAKS